MSHIVAKLEHEPDNGDLLITDQVEVAPRVEDAVNRIGSCTGDLFAVWSLPSHVTREQAAEYIDRFDPESVWIMSDDWPFELADRYSKQVRSPGRG
ncbi:hypothetical protein [Streptomyces sp. bgisy082]|uniref:hypothetical protein n=1 Tax=Streptomyces sp. bgisy082 TaxID=3413776 RepID=UPI003D75D73F